MTGVLVQLFPAMDTVSWRTVSLWLSVHLTNTKLGWPYWEHWAADYAAATEGDTHKSFIKILLEHCCRASLPGKIKSALPTALHDAIVEDFSPKVDDIFIRQDGVTPVGAAAVALELKSRVEIRQDASELLEWLEGLHEGVDDSIQVLDV